MCFLYRPVTIHVICEKGEEGDFLPVGDTTGNGIVITIFTLKTIAMHTKSYSNPLIHLHVAYIYLSHDFPFHKAIS